MSEVARQEVEGIRVALLGIAEAIGKQHNAQQITNDILGEIRDALKPDATNIVEFVKPEDDDS